MTTHAQREFKGDAMTWTMTTCASRGVVAMKDHMPNAEASENSPYLRNLPLRRTSKVNSRKGLYRTTTCLGSIEAFSEGVSKEKEGKDGYSLYTERKKNRQYYYKLEHYYKLTGQVDFIT